jgi:hypothetical protein
MPPAARAIALIHAGQHPSAGLVDPCRRDALADAASSVAEGRLCSGRVDVRGARMILARARQAKTCSTVPTSSTCQRCEGLLGLVLALLWEFAGGELGPPALGPSRGRP